MKMILKPLLGILSLFAPIAAVADTVRVVATTPDLADMAKAIGGDYVDVISLATGVEDPHSVPMKPSFALKLNRADLVIVQGLGLEHAFLPGLLDASRNPKIQPGTDGYIDCSKYIAPLEIPSKLDRALGEQHPLGNPHFNLDPELGRKMALAIEEGLERAIPEHAAELRSNFARYDAALKAAIEKWKVDAAPLRGIKYVSYHPDFIYLGNWLGMVRAGTIESKPGVDPAPGHVAELQETMRKMKVELVIRERHYPAELAASIASATGATLVELPIMTGGVPEAKDYSSFVNYNISKLVQAVKSRGGG